MAKYKDIVKDIEGCIRRGDLQPYDQLPTVVEMTKAYHVSRTTIEQVMDELEKRGLVSRKRGSGVYVKKVATQSFDKPLNTISLTDDIDVNLAKHPSCTVHEFTVVKPDEHVRHELGLHEFSFTFYIERSHLHNGQAIDVGSFAERTPETSPCALVVEGQMRAIACLEQQRFVMRDVFPQGIEGVS